MGGVTFRPQPRPGAIIELIEIEHVMCHGAFTARDAAIHLFESKNFLTSASSPYRCYHSSLPLLSGNQVFPPPRIAPYVANSRYAQGRCLGDVLHLPIGAIEGVPANAGSRFPLLHRNFPVPRH